MNFIGTTKKLFLFLRYFTHQNFLTKTWADNFFNLRSARFLQSLDKLGTVFNSKTSPPNHRALRQKLGADVLIANYAVKTYLIFSTIHSTIIFHKSDLSSVYKFAKLTAMKTDIHPKYYQEAKVHCAAAPEQSSVLDFV